MASTSFTAAVTTDVPGPNKRVFAFLIDGVVYSVALTVLTLVVPLLAGLWGYLLWSVFFLLRDLAGPSPGKRLTKLTILNEAGQPAGAAGLVLRNLPIVIPFVIFAEYFVMRQSSDGRRWGDRWANTRVRDLRPEVSDGKYLGYSIALVVVLILMQAFADRLPQQQTRGSAPEGSLIEAVLRRVEPGLAASAPAGARQTSAPSGSAMPQSKPLIYWIEALADRGRYEEAVRALDSAGPSAVSALSTAVLTHANPTVKRAAAFRLGQMGGPGVVATLLKAMKDPDGVVREEAVSALYSRARNRDPDIATAIPALTAALSDPVREVRMSASTALGRIGPPAKSAAPALLAAARKPDALVWFAEALFEIDPAAAREHALPLLISAYPREDATARSLLVTLLAKLEAPPDAVVPTLIRALDDESAFVRSSAASALRQIGPQAAAAIPRLTQALKDPDKNTRESAVDALARIRRK